MSDDETPWETLRLANNELFFGNKEGNAGASVFRAVLVVGTVMVLDPETGEDLEDRTYGAFNARGDSPEAIKSLLGKLEEMRRDIFLKYLEAVAIKAGQQ